MELNTDRSDSDRMSLCPWMCPLRLVACQGLAARDYCGTTVTSFVWLAWQSAMLSMTLSKPLHARLPATEFVNPNPEQQ